MAVAQGINVQFARVKQSALGSPGSTGSQLLRRVTATFQKQTDSYTSNEIVSHQQSTGATAGVQAVTGSINGELSPGTFQVEFENLLRKDAAATSAITGMSITIATSGSNYTITRAAGDFLTGGIKVGDIVRLTAGSFNAANLNKNLLVLAVTSTVLTVAPVNGVAMVAEGPIASATLSVPGKKVWTPTSGHTNTYLTYEKFFADISKSELFPDCKVAQAQIAMPATGIATIQLDVPGLSRTVGTAQVLTSPTAASTTEVLTAVQGKVIVNGAVTAVTSANVTISGNITQAEAEIGSNSRSDHQVGRIAVNGTITAKFSSTTLMDLRDAQTAVTLAIVIANNATGTSDFMTVVMPAVKLFSDDEDDGEKEIIRSYAFTAQIPATGGASLANHQAIVSMQDSQFA